MISHELTQLKVTDSCIIITLLRNALKPLENVVKSSSRPAVALMAGCLAFVWMVLEGIAVYT